MLRGKGTHKVTKAVEIGIKYFVINLISGFVPAASKPFVLTVVTNNDEIGDNGNRGFSLDFTQVRCANTLLVG